MAPSLKQVKSVGNNGIPLAWNSKEPPLFVPPGYDLALYRVVGGSLYPRTREAILRETRFMSYNDLGEDVFSIVRERTRKRLEGIEKSWVFGRQAMLLDTLYWDACYERHLQPQNFRKREAYLEHIVESKILHRAQMELLEADKKARLAQVEQLAQEALMDMVCDGLKKLNFYPNFQENSSVKLARSCKSVFNQSSDLESIVYDPTQPAILDTAKQVFASKIDYPMKPLASPGLTSLPPTTQARQLLVSTKVPKKHDTHSLESTMLVMRPKKVSKVKGRGGETKAVNSD